MADKKITQLDAVTSAANTDLLLIVRDPSTTPVNKKLEIGDLFGETSQTLVSNLNVASSSTATIGATVLTLNASTSITANVGVVINESGIDSDTRIESDANPNMVFVDASTNRVAFGASDPQEIVDINGNSIRLRSTRTPANSNNSFVGWSVGTIAWDENYLYIAVNSTTIKRITLGTF